MKKFIYLMIALAIAGALLSGFLAAAHYYPSSTSRIFSCGDALADPCTSVTQSRYSSVLGIPLAVFGLFFYLFLLFVLLVADYAEGEYERHAAAIILPVIALSLLFDCVLAVLLFVMRQACPLCIATYVINACLFAAAILWQRHIRAADGTGTAELYRAAFSRWDEPSKRASGSLFVIASFFLLLSVISTDSIVRLKSAPNPPTKQEITSFVEEFYGRSRITESFHETGAILGKAGAPVTIRVFTDYLCSACVAFYKMEKMLFARYGEDISIVYYNFPLDTACNRFVKKSRYPGSCIASRSFHAASALSVYREYFIRHFSGIKQTHEDYSIDRSLTTAEGLADRASFMEEMEGSQAHEAVARDIDLAGKLGVKATPTIIIASRILEGVPPREYLYAVIDMELKKAREGSK